ncbi:MAG: alpha/beta hydrolase [Pseudomonadota bacterium]
MDKDYRYSWTPEPQSGISVRFVEANGQRFELAAIGEGEHLVLCLHGFPELNFSWRHQMPMLAQMGYRVWAPNMRGYGASSKPEGIEPYRLDTLVQDVAALIDASGAKKVTLMAHDWGAIVAWHFAIKKIRPLERLIIMNVPHPLASRRELRHWHQLRKSWYIFFFQIPGLPEWGLSRDEAAKVRDVFYNMAVDKTHFTDDVLDIYAQAAAKPGAATPMINYYRALLRYPDFRDIGDGRVEVPTLMVWGEEDAAIDIRCTDHTDKWVSDLTLHRLPDVSHWVQQEAPEKVNAIVREWLEQQS